MSKLGMPLNKDPGKWGTEKDGSKNNMHCSFCYIDGEFNKPEIDTAKKMQEMCIEIMSKWKMPKWVAWIFTRSIPNLERWKKDKKQSSKMKD